MIFDIDENEIPARGLCARTHLATLRASERRVLLQIQRNPQCGVTPRVSSKLRKLTLLPSHNGKVTVAHGVSGLRSIFPAPLTRRA